MPRWRIYYADGTTFSSEDGTPDQAPGWGVVAIPQVDVEVGRMVMARWDHYCWHDDANGGQWWGHDIVGVLDCLSQPGWKKVLHGRTVSQDEWRRIVAEATADPDFPIKSASVPTVEQREGLR